MENGNLTSFDVTVKNFTIDRKAQGFTPRTLNHYAVSLKKFRAFLEQRDLALESITKHSLREFILWMQEPDAAHHPNGLKPKTVHGVMLDLRAFFRWVTEEEEWKANPMDGVKMPKLPEKLLEHHTMEEFAALKKSCSGKGLADLRNNAMIHVFLSSGIRLAELEKLDVGQVDLDRYEIIVLNGKGQRDRIARLTPKAVQALAKYLKARHNPGPHEPLWVGKRGRLTYFGVSQAISALGHKAGVHATPHKFRRTTSVNMLRSGANVYEVQHTLGHKDIQALKPYVKLVESDIRSAHLRHDPTEFRRAG